MTTRYFRKTKSLIGIAVLSLALAGCSGVELNGGIFDALGVSAKALSANKQEQKVEARPGIVMPPDTTRLPPPGSAPTAVATQNASWPVSPENRRQQQQAALQRQHDEFCRKAELRSATRGRDAEPEMGPLGSCKPGIGEMLFGRPARAQ